MKVIVVEKIENVAFEETFSVTVGNATISLTDKVYHRLTTILGVYISVDAARKALENEKMELMTFYGENALDDENIDDMHTYYTFSTRMLELEGTNNDDEIPKD